MNWGSSGYSQSDMSRMQREAIQRTREMQRRAREAANRFNRDFSGSAAAPKEMNNQHGVQKAEEKSAAAEKTDTENTLMQSSSTSSVKKLLESLNLDHEKIVLIGIMLILLNDGGLKEGKNQKLLMALAYLLFF